MLPTPPVSSDPSASRTASTSYPPAPPSYSTDPNAVGTVPNATLSSTQRGVASSSAGQPYEGPQPIMPTNLPFGAGAPPPQREPPPPPYQSPRLEAQNLPDPQDQPADLGGSYVLPDVPHAEEGTREGTWVQQGSHFIRLPTSSSPTRPPAIQQSPWIFPSMGSLPAPATLPSGSQPRLHAQNPADASRGEPSDLGGSYIFPNLQTLRDEEGERTSVQQDPNRLRLPSLSLSSERPPARQGLDLILPTIGGPDPAAETLPPYPQPTGLADTPPPEDGYPRQPPHLENRVSALEFGKTVMTGGSVISLASVFISTLSKRGSHPSLRIAAWAAFAAFGTGYFTLQSLGSEMQTPPNTPVQPNPIQPSETFIRLVTTLQALQQRVNLLLTRNTALHEQVQNLQGEVARLSRPLTPIASSSSAPPRAPLANTSLDESIRAIQERFQGINDTVQNLRQRLPQLQDTMTILETSFQQEYQIEETLDQLTSQPLPASQSVLTLSEGDEAILERLGLLDTIQRELREFANLIGTISTADEEINRQLAALQAQLLRR